MPAPKTFADMTSNKEWARQIKGIYDNKIDDVDPIVVMYAEDLIPGQGFSDTATRISLLMAAKWANSDRFLTTDMRPEVYTQVGYDWVQKTSMTDMCSATTRSRDARSRASGTRSGPGNVHPSRSDGQASSSAINCSSNSLSYQYLYPWSKAESRITG